MPRLKKFGRGVALASCIENKRERSFLVSKYSIKDLGLDIQFNRFAVGYAVGIKYSDENVSGVWCNSRLYWLMGSDYEIWPAEGIKDLGRSRSSLFFGNLGDSAVILNSSLSTLVSFPGITILHVEDNAVIFRDHNHRCGVMDFMGNILIEPNFGLVRPYNGYHYHFWVHASSANKDVFLWRPGENRLMRLSPEASMQIGVDRFAYGLYGYGRQSWGIMDSSGKKLCEQKFSCSGRGRGLRRLFFNRNLVQNENDVFGYCDENGEMVIPFQFQYGTDFKNGFALVTDNDSSYIINTKGQVIKNVGFKCTHCYRDGQDEKMRVYDKKGFLVKTDSGDCGIINIDGSIRFMIEAQYQVEAIDHFYDGFATVACKSKDDQIVRYQVSCIDRSGDLQFEPNFDWHEPNNLPSASGGLFPAHLYSSEDNMDKIGYADVKGNLVIDHRFNSAYPMYDIRYPTLETIALYNKEELQYYQDDYLPDAPS